MTSTVPAPEPADHTFNFGYLAAEYPAELCELPGWMSETFGTLYVQRHPLLPWAADHLDPVRAAVIGHPVDLDEASTDPQAIASNAARILQNQGMQAALRYVAYLGGRWTALLDDGSETIVVTDFAATQAVFWHHDQRGAAFSNYAHLLAEVTDAPLNQAYRDLMRNARELGATGTIYWPGVETPFMDVLPVLPNHALHLRRNDIPAHLRYYPFPETQAQTDAELAYGNFRDLFLRHVRLLCSPERRMGISLTGGSDSRTTLAAAAPYLDRDRTVTWTYIDTSNPHPGMAADLEAAVQLAGLYGLRHQVIDLNAEGLRALSPEGTDFGRSYDRSLKHTPQFRRLAVAYAEQLPPETVELQSMVAEVGTGFYKRRSGVPDVDRLAYLYSPSPFGEHPLVRSAFERYIDYADLTAENPGPLDWHDLFYLESRLGRWATLRIQEIDLSHRVLLPFNARGIVEALAGPPLEARVDKQALKRLVAEHELAHEDVDAAGPPQETPVDAEVAGTRRSWLRRLIRGGESSQSGR